MRSGLRWREKLVRTLLIFCFLAAIGLPIQTTQALASPAQGLITEVVAVGMTVSDVDRSLDFYSKVLSFEKVSDVEVWGASTSVSRGYSACGCGWYVCGSVMSSSS